MYPKLGCPSLLFSVTRPTLNGHPHRRPLFFGNLEKKVLLCPLSPFVRFISCPLFSFTYEICRGRRGSIWPNFAGQAPGKIWPNRAALRSAMRNARLDLAKFCPEAARQNLAKSSRAFLIAYEEQPDLAKFCPQAARQNLAKSSRAFLEARNYLNYFNY